LRTTILHTSFFQILLCSASIFSIVVYLVGALLVVMTTDITTTSVQDGLVGLGGITMGTIVAFSSYIGRLYAPMSDLSGVHIQLSTCAVSFEKIFRYLDLSTDDHLTPTKHEELPLLRLTDIVGDVRFEDVCFSYPLPGSSPGTQYIDKPVHLTIDSVSLHCRAGQTTAIVGANGSGKSTLALLLMGFLRPQRGEIFIDGHPLSRLMGPYTLAEHAGFLSQESYLLNDTVATNLRLGRADASLDELQAICRVVGIHDKIASLPQGYDTVVGHRAASLSGGEKQRLAIARVLLCRPKLLVLDEFDSCLDPESQRCIGLYIREQFSDRTRIIIAHR